MTTALPAFFTEISSSSVMDDVDGEILKTGAFIDVARKGWEDP